MSEFNQDAAVNTANVPSIEGVAAVKKSSKPKDYIKREDLTQEILKEYLELRDDGFFYWLKNTVRSLAGDWAGTLDPATDKYTVVFKGTTYNGVALRQFYNDGTWPAVTRGRAPALDADGNPIPKKERQPRVQRVAPVFTEEQKAAAREAHKAKLAAAAATQAAKKAADATRVSESTAAAEAAAPVQEAATDEINDF